MQVADDLLQGFLGFVLPGHVLKGGGNIVAFHRAGIGFAKAHKPAPRAYLAQTACEESQDQAEDQQRQPVLQDHIKQYGPFFTDSTESNACCLQTIRQFFIPHQIGKIFFFRRSCRGKLPCGAVFIPGIPLAQYPEAEQALLLRQRGGRCFRLLLRFFFRLLLQGVFSLFRERVAHLVGTDLYLLYISLLQMGQEGIVADLRFRSTAGKKAGSQRHIDQCRYGQRQYDPEQQRPPGLRSGAVLLLLFVFVLLHSFPSSAILDRPNLM